MLYTGRSSQSASSIDFSSNQPKCSRAAQNVGHVAYIVNQYPKVSHSFIRREIFSLERSGVRVERIAVRGWDVDVVDPDDVAEKQRTRYVLKDGAAHLLLPALRALRRDPRRFLSAARTALQLSRNHERRWPYHLVYLLEACRALEWIEEAGATHVHAHFGTNSAEVALLTRSLGGPPYSFTIHGPDEFDHGPSLAMAAKLDHAQFAIAISSYTRSQVYRFTDPRSWHKVKVVHCGLDPSFLDAEPSPPAKAHIIVCVGRLSEQKGQIILLEAVAALRADGLECRLVLVGDGEMRGLIEARISQLGLADVVEITGWASSDDVRRRILEARMLACPSFMEGLPVVIMEAMALRRPVVASSVAGIPELVVHGDTGWLVPAADRDALAAAIRECLLTSDADMQEIVERAHRRVSERHNIEHEARKLSELFATSGISGRPSE
jgi:colanic acid/amylovoran biosynthesis glycosyltransferase